jgi:hypothetical protein
MGPSWQPVTNMSNGASIGFQARESITETDSGAEYAVNRPNRRIAKFGLDWMSESEAMSKMYEMQRQLGTTGEVLFAWDLADALYAPNRIFLGRLRTLSDIVHVFTNIWSCRVEIGESL